MFSIMKQMAWSCSCDFFPFQWNKFIYSFGYFFVQWLLLSSMIPRERNIELKCMHIENIGFRSQCARAQIPILHFISCTCRQQYNANIFIRTLLEYFNAQSAFVFSSLRVSSSRYYLLLNLPCQRPVNCEWTLRTKSDKFNS